MNGLEIGIQIVTIVDLVVASIQDIRRKSIWLIWIAMLGLLSIASMIASIIDGTINYIWVITTILIGMVSMLINRIGRKNIGEADIIIVLLIALILNGVYYLEFIIITFGSVFVFSLTILTSRKANKEDIIPFIPFITIGMICAFITECIYR